MTNAEGLIYSFNPREFHEFGWSKINLQHESDQTLTAPCGVGLLTWCPKSSAHKEKPWKKRTQQNSTSQTAFKPVPPPWEKKKAETSHMCVFKFSWYLTWFLTPPVGLGCLASQHPSWPSGQSEPVPSWHFGCFASAFCLNDNRVTTKNYDVTKGRDSDTVDGRNPKQPPGMYKTL